MKTVTQKELQMLKDIDSNLERKSDLKEAGYKYVMECSWKNRANVWSDKFFLLENDENEKE